VKHFKKQKDYVSKVGVYLFLKETWTTVNFLPFFIPKHQNAELAFQSGFVCARFVLFLEQGSQAQIAPRAKWELIK